MATHVDVLPGAQQPHQEVAFEVGVQYLTEEEEVGHKGTLQNDGHVGSVEQLDRVGLFVSLGLLGGDGQLHSVALEVDHDQDHSCRRYQVDEIGRRLSIKSFTESLKFVGLSDEEVEEGNDGSLELSLVS